MTTFISLMVSGLGVMTAAEPHVTLVTCTPSIVTPLVSLRPPLPKTCGLFSVMYGPELAPRCHRPDCRED